MPSPVLVGELNPYGGNPRLALYDTPPGSAGERLRRLVLRIPSVAYRNLRRYNLCAGEWNADAARQRAIEIADLHLGTPIVLLGRKVQRSFDIVDPESFRTCTGGIYGNACYVLLLHPSGRCRAWNEPGAYERARRLVIRACPDWWRSVQ